LKTKNKNRINQCLQHFFIYKLFNVIFIDFLAIKQKLRNSVFERRIYFFKKINMRSPGGEPAMVWTLGFTSGGFTLWRTCYGCPPSREFMAKSWNFGLGL
jgi:hypothetical protein